MFKSDDTTLAARPTISGIPTSLDWGRNFTICVGNEAPITRACLIRPAATTHTFDQNQRYVPLTFTKAGNPPRLLATSPASPDSAPPGYYMLFVTGSTDGLDVPSIAKWVRLGVSTNRDTCDTVAPQTNADLTPDMISPSSISLAWTAPADDALLAASGNAQQFDLRYALSAITNESQWGFATSVSGEPVPGVVTTEHGVHVTGLQSCSQHYFQLRTTDDNTNLSGLHGEVKVKTLCSGGGLSAREARDQGREGSATAAAAASRGPIEPTSLGQATGILVAESSRDPASGDWLLTLTSAASPEGISTEDSGLALIQFREADGGWTTKVRPTLALAEDRLAIPALRDRRRVVFPAGFRLA